MTTQIEFTDRYGGNAPSWLRGCHGDCEAMGVVPMNGAELSDIDRTVLEHARGKSEDGWYFVECPSCHGTGLCSWLTTVARLPRWLWRGVRTCWNLGPRSEVWTGHPFGYIRRAWVAFKVAFLCDLGMRA